MVSKTEFSTIIIVRHFLSGGERPAILQFDSRIGNIFCGLLLILGFCHALEWRITIPSTKRPKTPSRQNHLWSRIEHVTTCATHYHFVYSANPSPINLHLQKVNNQNQQDLEIPIKKKIKNQNRIGNMYS